MKHTQQDMTFGKRLPFSSSPASIPFTYTLGGTRYQGFPAAFCPRTESERIDACITRHRTTAYAPGNLKLIADCYEYRDFAVCEWVMYIENCADVNSMTVSDWRFCAEFSAEKANQIGRAHV